MPALKGEKTSVRTDERLPLARGAGVARDVGVGEQAELALEGRHDLADVGAVTGEERALEEGLGCVYVSVTGRGKVGCG